MKLIIGLFLAFVSISSFAFQLNHDEKLSDLNQLVSAMKSGYGPLHYKKEALGIDIDKLKEKYTKLILKTQTNSEFYYLLVRFVADFRDGHFSASVPTTYGARLNFSVNWVNGKVLIDGVNRRKLSYMEFPFSKGDEIVKVDGIKINIILDNFSKYIGNGFKQTEMAMAAYRITNRPGRSFPVPENKTTTLTIKSGSSETLSNIEMNWDYYGDPLDEFSSFLVDNSPKNGLAGIHQEEIISPFRPSSFAQAMNYDNLSITSHFNDQNIDSTFHCSGGTRTAIPTDATIIMKKPFVAYYHPTAKGNIGYLRIPHYSPKNNEFELRYEQYKYAVDILEQNTVGLVIDQDHNCGGSVSYLNKLLGLFMNTPYKPMQFTLLANKREYLTYKNWLKTANRYTHEYLQAEKVSSLILDAWKNREFMTKKTSISGQELLAPRTTQYTKPILVLIDFWSGSGGDAFPSAMQGYGRAKLFGTRTMGLGGHVQEIPDLNYSRIKVRMTKSLFYRPDGVPVENNGAVPDVKYTITKDDFMNNFKGYQKAYLKEIQSMLP